jgi:hypothetical protein
VQIVPPAVVHVAQRLAGLAWVSDLLVVGSLATGDYVAGVSDVDLVAVTDGPVGAAAEHDLTEVHTAIDAGIGAGAHIGCMYVDRSRLQQRDADHPTWTHGRLVHRPLSGIVRAELVRHGHALFGTAPSLLLPPMTDDDVRRAARDEICGYWAVASRRPWWWLEPTMPDLGLTSMARGRHAMRTGQLLTKTAAIEAADAPDWLITDIRARRRGQTVTSPRLRSGYLAWRDTVRTVRWASTVRI